MALSPTPSLTPPRELPFMVENDNTYEWFRLFDILAKSIGVGSGLTLASVSASADLALLNANTASIEAAAAESTAVVARNEATAAQSTANTALSIATSTSSVQSNFLIRSNNLSDLTSAASARTNLGLDVSQISTTFDSCASVTTKYIPLIRAYNLPANFSGSLIWAGTTSTVDATFTFRYIRNNVTTTIGTMSLIHSGNFPGPSTGNPISLQAGDVLTVSCPSDATLAQVGVSLKLTNA